MIKNSKHIITLLLTSALVLFSIVTNAQEVNVIDKKGTIVKVNNNLVTTSAIAPTSPVPVEGDIWFDTTTNSTKVFDPDLPLPVSNQWKKLTTVTVTVVNKTADYTLVLADNGNVFTFNSATDVTLTVPTGLPIGFNISIYQTGIGKVTVQGGATILNRLSRFKTAGKDAGAGLIATATDIFHLTGDLKK